MYQKVRESRVETHTPTVHTYVCTPYICTFSFIWTLFHLFVPAIDVYIHCQRARNIFFFFDFTSFQVVEEEYAR